MSWGGFRLFLMKSLALPQNLGAKQLVYKKRSTVFMLSLRQFRLLVFTSFIGNCVHPAGGDRVF